MSIVHGSGPLAPASPGATNIELDLPERVVYLEPTPRRIRAEVEGRAVLESGEAMLLHDSEGLPTYYVPLADIRAEHLTDEATSAPDDADPLLGVRRSWTLSVGGRREEGAVWVHPEPGADAPSELAGLAAVRWDAVDAWFEEDEEVFVHPRDPYHRVDVRRSGRRVRVRAGDVLLAETRRPHIVFETSLEPRVYLPREDVDMGRLEPSEKRSGCPYKGEAVYYSVRAGDRLLEDAAWSYLEPDPAVEEIRDMISFRVEHPPVEVEIG